MGAEMMMSSTPMMSSGFDPVSDARHKAITEAESRWTREQIALLWRHMSKRQSEIQRVDERLSGEIADMKKSINGAVRWLALAVGGVLFSIVRAKLGL